VINETNFIIMIGSCLLAEMIDENEKLFIILFLLIWIFVVIWMAIRRERRYAISHHQKFEYYWKMKEIRNDVKIFGEDTDPSRIWGWALAALGQACVSIFCIIEVLIIQDTFEVLLITIMGTFMIPLYIFGYTKTRSIIIFSNDGIEICWTMKRVEPLKIRWSSVLAVKLFQTSGGSIVSLIRVEYDRGEIDIPFGNKDFDVLKEIMKHVPYNIINPMLLDTYSRIDF